MGGFGLAYIPRNMLDMIVSDENFGLAYGRMSGGDVVCIPPCNVFNIITLDGMVGLAYGLMSEGHGAV